MYVSYCPWWRCKVYLCLYNLQRHSETRFVWRSWLLDFIGIRRVTPLHRLITHPKHDFRSVLSNLTLIVGPTHKRNMKLFMINNTANLWKPTLVKYISVLRNTKKRVFSYQCQRTANEVKTSSFFTKISVMIWPSWVDFFFSFLAQNLATNFSPGFTLVVRAKGNLLLRTFRVQRAHTYITATCRIIWCTACDKRSASFYWNQYTAFFCDNYLTCKQCCAMGILFLLSVKAEFWQKYFILTADAYLPRSQQ